MTATFETLLGIDRDLVAAGHHALSPWWREQLQRFYAHPTARTLVARVGRGGAKSRTAVIVSLNEVLYGDWSVPPGEMHFWAFVSASRDEAAQRLTLIRRCLLDLEIPHDPVGEEIRLKEMPRGWRVFACQIGAVSGFRAFGRTGDELAKWRAADRFANPAEEVVTSLDAMCVTHPGSRSLLFSSPMGHTDYHAKRFKDGDTAHQLVCHAPTWIANPSVTEEHTHQLCPDPRMHAREYGAIPQAGSLTVFEPDAIEEAFKEPGAVPRPVERFGVIDASSGKKDAWTYGIASWCDVGGVQKLVFEKVEAFEGNFFKQLDGEAVVQAVADCMKSKGARDVHADQRESLMLRSAFLRNGLRFYEHPWTPPSKERAVSIVRRWLAEKRLILPMHEKLRDELMDFEERIAPSGGFTFGARGSGHDDFVALLITAAIADSERLLKGSPGRKMGIYEALSAGARQRADAARRERLERAAGLRQ